MWAVLGTVQFELPAYVEGMEMQAAAEYAEHPLIGGKPRLQRTGDKLDEYRFQLYFHAAYCNPELELRKLLDLVRSREARQLVLGNGLNKGWMVAVEAQAMSRQTDAQGNLITLEASLWLREHVEPVTPQTRRAQEKTRARNRTSSAPKRKATTTPTKPAGAGRGWINPDGTRSPRD
ncbi:phage tail protein [Acidovorax sp. GBBC 3332]|nr:MULTISPECIES: phage tail protein [unclassified Acidovorax]MDA8449842.1 phage tail protein [Acidovorax sp. GBBC 3297]MDA8459287.1 phage tail protein [Acidovorax sp. GBBC 3333]MDA8464324.1 phage tail protein [Acidovorax sp. GBBC 3332]MDA8469465.1 phage tail protein [Acidovorax sp. GBBC 3299]